MRDHGGRLSVFGYFAGGRRSLGLGIFGGSGNLLFESPLGG